MNDTNQAEVDVDVVAEITAEEEGIRIRAKIQHILTIYPGISETMLQSGLGPGIKPVIWRPIMNIMIEEGKIRREIISVLAPSNRYNSYVKLHLTEDS